MRALKISIKDIVIWWPKRPELPKVIKKDEAEKDGNQWTAERTEGIKEKGYVLREDLNRETKMEAYGEKAGGG